MGAINALFVKRTYSGEPPAPPAAPYVNNRVLAADVAETVTPPAGAKWVNIAGDGDFWARYDGTAAAIPVADVTDGTGSVLNPTIRNIDGVATFSVIASAARKLSLEFWT